MTKITKAAILYRTGEPLIIKNIKVPDLKPGQVLVKVSYSGLCRSQINEIQGHKGKDEYLPHTLGHEGSGFIEEVGTGVTKVSKGDSVVLTWIRGKGMSVHSTQYFDETEKINSGAISTFLQYAVVSENCVVSIPENIPKSVAALFGCAIPTGGGIVKNEIDLQKEDSLAIFGVGGIGSSVLLQAMAIGCSSIIAIDVNDTKLEFAKSLGAFHCINSSREDPILKIKELFKGGVNYAVECSGIASVMETAFQAIHNSGKVIIAGNLAQGKTISIDPFDLIKGKNIVGTWGGATKSDEDIDFYTKQYQSGNLPAEKLISKEYSLAEINKAIEDLEKGHIIRALINCQE